MSARKTSELTHRFTARPYRREVFLGTAQDLGWWERVMIDLQKSGQWREVLHKDEKF